MNVANLPSPGMLSTAIELRRMAARAISTMEVVASSTPGGKARGAQQLADFFTFCASAAAAVADSVRPLALTATADNANKRAIVQTFDQPLDASITYDPAQFTTNPARTVTNVQVNPANKAQLFINLASDLPAGAVSYSYAATTIGHLRDAIGNPVTSYSGKSVTNTIS